MKIKGNKAKRFAKQLLSDVINALASVYCCQNQTALKTNKKKKLQCSFVNCFSKRKAVKMVLSSQRFFTQPSYITLNRL